MIAIVVRYDTLCCCVYGMVRSEHRSLSMQGLFSSDELR